MTPSSSRRHTRRLAIGLALLLGTVAPGAGLRSDRIGAQEQRPTFGSTVSVTRVKVAVLDRAGNPVPDLGVDDFRVFDDGDERAVTVLLAPERTPLDLAVIPDFSTSVAESWPDARERVLAFLDALGAEDCVYLLPFNSRVGPGAHEPAPSPLHRMLMQRFPMSGSTRLYDALFAGYAGLGGGPSDDAPVLAGTGSCRGGAGQVRRRAIVLLTDGADAGSRYSYRDVLMQAWRADIPVFPVAVGVAALPRGDLEGYRSLGAPREEVEAVITTQDQLRELARVSGGRLVTQREIRDGYAEVLALVSGYYVLGYRTPEPRREGWHEVSVRLRETDGRRVVFQPGYYGSLEDPDDALAALEEGQRLLQERRFLEALAAFGRVARRDLEVGFPDLGMAIAHEGLGQLEAARLAYLRELDQHPGLGSIHLRLARLYLRRGELRPAWEHAVVAELGGEPVGDLLQQLRRRGQPDDLGSLRRRPVLFVVRPKDPGLEAQLLLGRVLRALGVLVESRPGLVLTRNAAAATHYVRLDVDRLRESELRADLELWSATDGERLERESLRLDDPFTADLAAGLRPVLEDLLADLAAGR